MERHRSQIFQRAGSTRSRWVATALLLVVLLNVIALVYFRSTRAEPRGPFKPPEPPKPLPLRLKLIDGMAGESILESVAKLDDYKDFSIIGGGLVVTNLGASEESYRFQWENVPKLNRVRKICAELPVHRTTYERKSSSIL